MLTVAVIDDNYPVRKGLSHKINSLSDDFSVIGDAGDSVEGLSLILSKRPQIVVTDIRLPGSTGLSMIKEIYRTYHPQVIVISGYAEFEYAREALSLGVIAYLVKPVVEEELKEALNKAAANLTGEAASAKAAALGKPSEEYENAGAIKSYYAGKVVDYIEKHYTENLKIGNIAEELALSESYLSRTFREETGFTITDYRTCYSIAMAACLLENPELKVYEVAEKTGYSDQRYFSRIFRQRVGLTPLEYREMILSGHEYIRVSRDDYLFENMLKSIREKY